MVMRRRAVGFALLAVLCAAIAAEAAPTGAKEELPIAAEAAPTAANPASAASTRLLIGIRDSAGHGRPAALRARLRAKAALRGIGPRTLAARLDSRSIPAEALAALRSDPDVTFVDVDHRRFAHALPSDPLFLQQWYLQSVETAATHSDVAWDDTVGHGDVVIAVLDTGVRFEHPDLGRFGRGGRLLPGRDFVSGESATSFASANDGDGWDDDPSDPGDWVSEAEAGTGPFRDCAASPASSWHGTRVTAMVGAVSNDGEGMAGGTWEGPILPVRVLGKCGGYDSDIIAGMRWAAGLPVNGVPTNTNPARVINLSLGSVGTCTAVYQSVIAELNAVGVVVVVSAGNESGPVDVPANCPGAVAVAGLRHAGTKVGYSSRGPEVALAAPAGNCVNTSGQCLFSLVTATNTGTTTPGGSAWTDGFRFNVGTSFAAPIVSAVAGLMLAVNPELLPAELRARLQAGTRSFTRDARLPTCPAAAPDTLECNCTTTTCGAGIADARGGVAEALRPIARITTQDPGTPGQSASLGGAESRAARDRQIVTYAWSAAPGGLAAFVGAVDGPDATVTLPAAGELTVSLLVTDDTGRQDTRTITLGQAVAPASGGGGGGGAVHPAMTLLLILLSVVRRRRSPTPAQR